MKKVGFVVCIFLLTVGTAYAQESDRSGELEKLRRQVEEQNKIIQELLYRIEALESTQDEQGDWIENEKTSEPSWTERVKLRGDLRLRYDYTDDERAGDDRHRNRFRARLGTDARLADNLDIHFEITTSPDSGYGEEGNPVRRDQTMTNAFSFKRIWLSEAYFDWRPNPVPGLRVMGGKIKFPFTTVGGSELIWDGDLNPEGGALKYTKAVDSTEFFGNLFGFWLLENKDDEDSGLFGVQGGVRQDFTLCDDNAHVLVGMSYFDYVNVHGEEPFFDSTGDDFGNSLAPNGTLANDFDLFETFGEFGFRPRGIPVVLFADYVTNTAASEEDDGWSVGFMLGRRGQPRTWTFRYLYKEVERDAVIGGFTGSVFAGGGTDADGHEINLAYQVSHSVRLAASLYFNETEISGDEEDYDRFLLDMLFSF